jgi:hypothetical protein
MDQTKGLCLWVSWVDDCLVIGSTKEAVAIAKMQLMSKFDRDKILATWTRKFVAKWIAISMTTQSN